MFSIWVSSHMYEVKTSLQKCLITFLLIVTFSDAYTQFVNIETARFHSDSTGLMGEAGVALSLTKNTQTVLQTEVDTHIQYKTKKNVFLLLGSYGYLKSGDRSLIDNTFFHLRYNRKLNKWFRWEFFTQFQNNEITKIKNRFLFGSGPRFKIVYKKNLKLYAGSLIIYEVENEETDPPITNKDFRNSSYVTFTLIPSVHFEVVSTTFYQPIINKLSDYRILNQTSFKVKGTTHFSMSLQLNYSFDKSPVIGIPNDYYSLSTRFGYDF